MKYDFMRIYRYQQVIVLVLLALLSCVYFFYKKNPIIPVAHIPIATKLYTGTIYHIFFHSLIIYPELAYNGNRNTEIYKNYMVTQSEFRKILPRLYADNFVLIDEHLLYTTNPDGSIVRMPLYIPVGKKPLILSLDDLNYYETQQNQGLAHRLTLDAQGNVATEVITPSGTTTITRDGDVIPLVDDFVQQHPDFSFGDAKGIIALTGHDGILGYRTQNASSTTYAQDIQTVKKIISRLKETGWQFASHTYSHDISFQLDTITLDQLKLDTELWNAQVRPLVGDTDIFVGPFGQIFKPGDPRRSYLVDQGFKALYGVGMDLHLQFYPAYFEMDRADMDDLRIHQTPELLKEYFDPKDITSN